MTGEHDRSGRAPAVWGRGRRLLLQAAAELFEEKGYASTSTKEIAARASVSEAMIFRHFGSKAALYEEVLLAPFNEFMETLVEQWEQRNQQSDPLDDARDFYRGVFEFFVQNRESVRVLLAADVANVGKSYGKHIFGSMGAILDRFEMVSYDASNDRGLRDYNNEAVVRLMFGMAFAVAVYGDWMYAGGSNPRTSEAEYIEEMALLTVHGLGHPVRPVKPRRGRHTSVSRE